MKANSISKRAGELAKLDYPFNVRRVEDGYYIEFPDLPGCSTIGDTLKEAIANTEEAKLVWIDACLKLGKQIPAPSQPEEYSGRFIVRCPRLLHKRLAEYARVEGISLNQYIVSLLSAGAVFNAVQKEIEKQFNQWEQKVTVISYRKLELPSVSKEWLYAKEEEERLLTDAIAQGRIQ